MVTRAIAAGAAVVLLAGPAVAERLPTWDVASICRNDSAPGQCRIAEAQAMNTISATWDLLPTDVRSACLAEVRAPADHSWRILASCIEGEVLRAKSQMAIATRNTPAWPELSPLMPAEPVEVAPAMPDPAAEEAMPGKSPGSADQQ